MHLLDRCEGIERIAHDVHKHPIVPKQMLPCVEEHNIGRVLVRPPDLSRLVRCSLMHLDERLSHNFEKVVFRQNVSGVCREA